MIYQIHKDHGKHMPHSSQEAEANLKNGWRTVTEEEFFGRPSLDEIKAAGKVLDDQPVPTEGRVDMSDGVDLSHDHLVELYELKFQKKPHWKMLDATIKAAIDGNNH